MVNENTFRGTLSAILIFVFLLFGTSSGRKSTVVCLYGEIIHELTVQADKPCSILLVARYLVYTLHNTGYLGLKFGFVGNMLQHIKKKIMFCGPTQCL